MDDRSEVTYERTDDDDDDDDDVLYDGQLLLSYDDDV